MKMSKIGNQTNSQDPQAVNSRIFVGNLNTFQCSKTDIERMFQRYGRLAGISMHKGYAFVQFLNPLDARNACIGEDSRNIMNQVLDVNMVAEPKPHQTGRKRQNLTKTGNDWDYYYDSYYATTNSTTTVYPPNKKKRTIANVQQSNGATQNTMSQTDVKVYNNPDILICGNCRESFSSLLEMYEHKMSYCKLRFFCKCHQFDTANNNNGDSVTLLCSNCKETFSSPFDLMVHVQSMHFMNIFHVGSTDASTNTAHKVVQLLNNEENNETYQENHRREENQQMDSLAKEVLEVTNESSSEPNHININDNNDNYLSNNTHGYHLGSDGNSIIDENDLNSDNLSNGFVKDCASVGLEI